MRIQDEGTVLIRANLISNLHNRILLWKLIFIAILFLEPRFISIKEVNGFGFCIFIY